MLMVDLSEQLEAQITEVEFSSLDSAQEAVTALRRALAADSTVAELVARMTPEELRGVLNKMAWAAYYQSDPAAAEIEFQTEFSYLEDELAARSPQLSSLESTTSVLEAATDELELSR